MSRATYTHTEDCPICILGRMTISFAYDDPGYPIADSVKIVKRCPCALEPTQKVRAIASAALAFRKSQQNIEARTDNQAR